MSIAGVPSGRYANYDFHLGFGHFYLEAIKHSSIGRRKIPVKILEAGNTKENEGDPQNRQANAGFQMRVH
jgi:hypothetical protein